MAIYQKKVSVGQYAKKGEDFMDGDVITIASEGQQVQGTYGVQNVFLMKLKTGEKNMNVNQTSLNNIIDAYGPDSLKWIGKQLKVWLIMQVVSGKMQKVVYLSHPLAELVEDKLGIRFAVPGTEDMRAPRREPSDYPESDGEIPF